MELYQAILTRRSIRRFHPTEVTNEILEHVLKAAMYAPSAKNAKPWEFVVVNDSSILEKLSEVQPYTKLIKGAPMAIVVCGNTKLEKQEGFWVQDCSACMQNLLLAIHDKGLGAVWCGVHPIKEAEDKVRELLGIPQEVVPLSICVLGYPDHEPKQPEKRYNPEKIHYNKY